MPRPLRLIIAFIDFIVSFAAMAISYITFLVLIWLGIWAAGETVWAMWHSERRLMIVVLIAVLWYGLNWKRLNTRVRRKELWPWEDL